ncbi:type I DNA topoisomerase [Crocosphaera chwakensis]|uniref:DNA topoisomerase 1 n=1 Tax=Crocosphaera chwakensis CCY0110 TaxID=391612 RepID=A3IYK5_9CHRO|nr:type I DNA topoisomerase [Crocosphaera chwakensis]EAZ88454.1 DNA topoisomerase I [Crocosphaera chwakensis CCY0110]
MPLLIVESPNKIKKLKQILGSGWLIKASLGHVRELARDGDDNLGFTLTSNGVNCRFVPRNSKAAKIIKELKTVAKNSNAVYFASDPDREGETIAWHLAQELGVKNPQRVVYQEITEKAVLAAVKNPRPLDQQLVDAGLARACLDKLVGYRGSPLLWKQGKGGKSVGRVQSAALHILCHREREILNFKPVDYWSVWVDYQEGFRAFYLGQQEQPSDNSLDNDDAGGDKAAVESSRVLSEADADRLSAIARSNPHKVLQVEGKTINRKPPAPFTTSTLQQAAGSRLKMNPETTMKVAQHLYEQGLITYMRTDSTALSDEFCQSVRRWLQAKDPKNLPSKLVKHRQSKNAQEAHEAIRPTDITRPSAQLKQELDDQQFQLYLIIWMRSVASLCNPARLLQTKIITQSGEVKWLAKGQVMQFEGYTKYWNNISNDSVLPTVQQGQPLTLDKAGHDKKQTQPPPRYTEPKLVQAMEKKGIGRPSTYAPTVKTLKQREYVKLTKGKLLPTPLGLDVDEFLGKMLPELLQAEFTAQMEGTFDAIASGQQDWQKYLTTWNQEYFDPTLNKAWEALGGKPANNNTTTVREKSDVCCPQCQKPLSKIPSKSKKLTVPYFLKCQDDCDVVMFFDKKLNKWVQPGESKPNSGEELTQYSCPVCSKPLQEYSYQKDGQDKVMLRCSNSKGVKDSRHKDVAFFMTKDEKWWSKKYGILE